MRAIILDGHGDIDVLRLVDTRDPAPGPEEVLVEVAATALNRADTLQRQGLYPGPPMDPEIPGLEYAGVIAAVGERVTERTVGERVMGIVAGGAYAERLVTHERLTMSAPASLSLIECAALPEVFVTAYDALVLQGGLRPGGTALVHAGASGVGTAAIQICSAIGARVIVTCSTGKVDACRELGADLVVDYTAADFVAACRDLTGGVGVDAVLDVIGGDYADKNIRAVRTGGRIIQVGVMGGGSAPVNLGLLLMKRATLTGTTLRSRPIEEKIAIVRRAAHDLGHWFDDGTLKPVIDSIVEAENIGEAHRRLESNVTVGKIVVRMTDGSRGGLLSPSDLRADLRSDP